MGESLSTCTTSSTKTNNSQFSISVAAAPVRLKLLSAIDVIGQQKLDPGLFIFWVLLRLLAVRRYLLEQGCRHPLLLM